MGPNVADEHAAVQAPSRSAAPAGIRILRIPTPDTHISRSRALGDSITGQRRGRPFPKALIVALDALAIFAAIGLATAVTDGRVYRGGKLTNFPFVASTLPIWAVAMARQSLYQARRISRGVDETGRIMKASFAAVGGTALLSVIGQFDLSRAWMGSVLIFAIVALSTERFALRLWFRKSRRQARLMRKVMILGVNAEARALHHNLTTDPSIGYEVVGFIDDERLDRHVNVEMVHSQLRSRGAQGIIIAATSIDLDTSNRLIRGLTDHGIHVELSSTLVDIAHDRLTVRPLGRFPMVYIEPVKRTGWRPLAKRGFDVVVASSLLLLALPVMAACGIAVKLTSPGPILFRQVRVGRDGKPFKLLKIRSMHRDAEAKLKDIAHLNEVSGPIFKIRNDPRITPVGRFLRKASLDELPQLVNVIRGEMSLVGPRPALPSEAAQWDEELTGRLRVQPGITGMWQVHGRGSDGSDYAQLDLYYVDNWSLVADLSILVRTLPVVIFSRGAY